MKEVGRRVLFVLRSGDEIEPPARDALLHDPTGRWWSSRAVLVGPTRPGPIADDPPDYAVEFLGKSHTIHEDHADLPPKSGWARVGEVDEIFYHRTGARHVTPTRSKRHAFNRDFASKLLFGDGKATLYERGRWLQLKLSGTVILDPGEFFGFP